MEQIDLQKRNMRLEKKLSVAKGEQPIVKS